ncbi:hypothetical protein BH11CYA1_BH11CYA1_00580 [soil metagenome]
MFFKLAFPLCVEKVKLLSTALVGQQLGLLISINPEFWVLYFLPLDQVI